MKARTFIVLAALTVLAVAAVIVVRPPVAPAISGVGERVFPDLPGRLENATTIVVRGPHETVTLERGPTGWSIRERGSYPASFDKIRAAVIALTELERQEPKTSRADGFVRLGVSDVDDATATGREISILDASGAPLARVIVGKTINALGGETSEFIRVPGEDRAWLVRGHVDAGATPRDWIDRRLLDIPAGEVRRLHVVRPDGSTLTIVRDAPNAPQLKLEELPKGMRLKRPEGLEQMIGAVAGLEIDDVKPIADVEGANGRTRIELTTFGGEIIAATILERGDERWMTFSEPAAMAGRQLAGWAFQLPAWKFQPMLKPIADLVEADTGAPAEPASPAPMAPAPR